MAKLSFRSVSYQPDGPPRAIIFFVASLGTKYWYYQPVFRVLNRRGFLLQSYDYHPFLRSDPEELVPLSHNIVDDMAARVKAYKSVYPGIKFGMIGASAGSIMALRAAKIINDFERILLVTVYGSTALQVWDYLPLNHMRQTLINKNLGLAEAYKIFEAIEPLHQLHLIGKRPILVFGSLNDPVIKHSNTKILLDEAKNLGLDLTFVPLATNKHIATIIRAFWGMDEWLPFFEPLLKTNIGQALASVCPVDKLPAE
ncbi:MAG: alpha/beta hydrolase family protein [Candidatus Saccharimonadales bacterium]